MSSKDLLLVVDVQNGFVNDRSRHVVGPIREFTGAWLEEGGLVAFTKFINDKDSQWERLIHWTRLRSSPETDLDPSLVELAAHRSSHVFEKRSYTSLTPELRALLGQHSIERVLLCGIATDGCVLKSAVDLFESGRRPIVLSDLCSSHAGTEVHEAGLLLISRFIGSDQVMVSDDVPVGA